MLGEVRTYARLLAALGPYLRDQLSPEECRARIQARIADKEGAFVRILERGVYANPRSPYRRLLEHAGIELGDAGRLVREQGVEGALHRLYDAGVHITLEEFKCRRPIVRPGLELPVRVEDFDNPLLTKHYELSSGGSRSAGRRTHLDLGALADDATHHSLAQDAFGTRDRPWAVWHAIPPAGPGIKVSLMLAKLGTPVERWFAPTELSWNRRTARFLAFTRSTVLVSRLWGSPVPAPEYVPPSEALRVAEWLAAKKAAGTPAAISTIVSLGVRAALAAREHELDIAGTFFRLHAEALTPAREAIISATGSRAAMGYGMSELGMVGLPCAAPADLDDVHLLGHKVAIVQRDKRLEPNGPTVGTLLFTTLLPSCPKLMLNVDVGDYGRLGERDCGCPIAETGLRLHLSNIRSYDKLTSEGSTFLGADLITLVEETLPTRFGGAATDYQLVEHEQDGLTKVNVVVSPRIGRLDEAQVVETVLRVLHANPDLRLMADVWREGDAVRVLRREPYTTAMSKILPLHVPQPKARVGGKPQP